MFFYHELLNVKPVCDEPGFVYQHPVAMLFGSSVAGAGVGIDNIAFVSWFMCGGGRDLYDQLWTEMDMNV